MISRWAARLLSIAWAAWWIFFGIDSALRSGASIDGIIMQSVMPGGFFLASALMALRWEILGGIVLFIEGAILTIGYPIIAGRTFDIGKLMFVEITMALPALIAGILLLWSARTDRLKQNNDEKAEKEEP